MPCNECGSTKSVVENNYVTCTNCGLESTYEPKYIRGYATPFYPIRKQYYSRIKRFSKKLRSMCCDVIGENTELILQVYGLLEFCWNMSQNKKRKYFFSQKVVLFFILGFIGVDLKVPVLKNQLRTQQQLERMAEILKLPGQ